MKNQLSHTMLRRLTTTSKTPSMPTSHLLLARPSLRWGRRAAVRKTARSTLEKV